MDNYIDNLRKIKSLLIVTSLKKKIDLKAFKSISKFDLDLNWSSKSDLMISDEVWNYVTAIRKYDPKFVFCHPEVVKKIPYSSLYYRGLTGLSTKAAKEYIGSIENLEKENSRIKLNDEKALKMARVYNTFICSIISGSTDWTIEDGKRTIIATLGITLDGVMRNKVGTIAEERVRNMIFEWLVENNLIISQSKIEIGELQNAPVISNLAEGIVMEFSSEPDISFEKNGELLAVIEIKGGIDPAGALERYGAATKSFQHSLKRSPKCKNFFLSAVYTTELTKRIQIDRLVEKYYDIVEILEDKKKRDEFFQELFHYTLRII